MSKELEAYETAEKRLTEIEAKAQDLAKMVQHAGNMLVRHSPSQWLLVTNPTVDDRGGDGSLVIDGNSDEGPVCSADWPHFGKFLAIQQEASKARAALKEAFTALSEAEKRLVQAAKGKRVDPSARFQRSRY